MLNIFIFSQIQQINVFFYNFRFFEIKYYVNNTEVDGSDFTKPLFKIHNCFMESFATDYTTSSLVSFMDDGNPLTTTISMGFKETQLLTKTDIDAGY